MATYPAQLDVIEAELELALAESEAQEVEAGGRPVRDDIAALAATATQLRDTLTLRQSFLAGDRDAEEAELRQRFGQRF